MKFAYLTIISVFFLLGSLNSQNDFQSRLNAVDATCDSLAKIYGSLPKKEKEIFKYSVAVYENNMFAYKEVDRAERYENYLARVFKTIHPGTTVPGIYLYESAYPNAFTVFGGNIFFHWGILADIEDEASLAYIMGHEITHHEAAHLYLTYLKRPNNKNSDRAATIKSYHSEQQQEYYADSIGFVLGEKAGYHWESGLSDFYEFMSLDTILMSLHKKTNVYDADGNLVNDVYYNDKSDTLFTTHPPTNSRINKWKYWGRQSPTAKKFIVDEKLFREMQEYAREKSLENYLQQKDYRIGLIKAFKYYILSPSNKKYKYYLLEFLRRKTYYNPGLYEKPFLSDVFGLETGKSIYDNMRWVCRSDNDLKTAKQNLTSVMRVKGDTYQDLINFLTENIGDEYPEFYLTLALMNTKNEELKGKFIDRYLSFPDVKFPDFAMAYKQNELSYKFRDITAHWVVYGGTDFLLRNKSGISHETLKDIRFEKKINDKLYSFIERKHLKDYKLFNEQKLLAQGSYEDFAFLVEPHIYSEVNQTRDNSSGLRMRGEGKALLSPELWTYFYKNKIRELSYVNAASIKDKTVSPVENLAAYFRSISPGAGLIGRYFGKTRLMYEVNCSTIEGSTLAVKNEEVVVKTRLSSNLLITEIYLFTK